MSPYMKRALGSPVKPRAKGTKDDKYRTVKLKATRPGMHAACRLCGLKLKRGSEAVCCTARMYESHPGSVWMHAKCFLDAADKVRETYKELET